MDAGTCPTGRGLLRTRRFQHTAIASTLIAWAMCLSVGFGMLMDYSFTPGAGTLVTHRLPPTVRTALDLDPGRPAIIVLAHAGCPCTRATLAELERAIAQIDSPIQVRVVCAYPEARGIEWAANRPVWRIASRIEGVHVSGDADGRLARSLGVATSGHVLFYDADGNLRFSGGITSARGHEGANVGRSTLVSRIIENHMPTAVSPVFGCALFNDDDSHDSCEEPTRCR